MMPEGGFAQFPCSSGSRGAWGAPSRQSRSVFGVKPKGRPRQQEAASAAADARTWNPKPRTQWRPANQPVRAPLQAPARTLNPGSTQHGNPSPFRWSDFSLGGRWGHPCGYDDTIPVGRAAPTAHAAFVEIRQHSGGVHWEPSASAPWEPIDDGWIHF